VTRGHRRLEGEVKGLGVSYDQSTQLPNLITVMQPASSLTRGATTAGGTPVEPHAGGQGHDRGCLGQPAEGERRASAARNTRYQVACRRRRLRFQHRQHEDGQPHSARRGQRGL
jgi:hypothetical protein